MRTKQLTYIDIHISDAQFYFVVFLVYTCYTKASKQRTSNETYCTNSAFTNIALYNISGESFRRSHSLSCIVTHFCNFFIKLSIVYYSFSKTERRVVKTFFEPVPARDCKREQLFPNKVAAFCCVLPYCLFNSTKSICFMHIVPSRHFVSVDDMCLHFFCYTFCKVYIVFSKYFTKIACESFFNPWVITYGFINNFIPHI